MAVITEEWLKYILEKKQLTQSVSSHSRQSTGPAEIDKWLLFTPDSNCFLHPEEKKETKNKKKLILSNYLLNCSSITSLDMSILESLAEHYDVYLWPGEDVGFATTKPLSKGIDIWENRESIKGATKANVLSELAKQGQSTDDMTILDFKAYEELANEIQLKEKIKYFEKERGSHILNLEYFNGQDAEACQQIMKSLDASAITMAYSSTLTEHEIRFIKQFPLNTLIPNLNSISTDLLENKLLNNYKSLLDPVKVKAYNIVPEPRKNPKIVTITNESQLSELLKSDVSEIEQIEITKMERNELDLSRFKKLTDIKLSFKREKSECKIAWPKENKIQKMELFNFRNFESIHSSELPHLTELVIFPYEEKLDLRAATNIKKLTTSAEAPILLNKEQHLEYSHLHNINSQKSLDQLPDTIKEIEIKLSSTSEKLDFKRFRNLRRLKIISENSDARSISFSQDADITIPIQLEELKVSGTYNINFTGANKLKMFYAIDSNISAPDLTPCKELESFIIYNSKEEKKPPTSINMSSLPKLKQVIMNNVKIEKLNLSENNSLRQLSLTNPNPAIQLNLDKCDNLNVLELNKLDSVTCQHPQEYKNLRYCRLNGKNVDTFLDKTFPNNCETEILSERSVQHALSDANRNNPVSLFSLQNDEKVDNQTAQDKKPHIASDDFAVTLIGKNIDKRRYRIKTYDKAFHDNKNNLSFQSSLSRSTCIKLKDKIPLFDEKKLQQIKDRVAQNQNEVAGIFVGTMQTGKLYPLPVNCALSEKDLSEIYCKPSDAVKLYWSKSDQQYYIKTKKNNVKVEILYQFKTNSNYYQKPTEITLQKLPLLPLSLHKALEPRIREHKPLQFLFSKDMSPAEKVIKLTEYCQSFKIEALKAEAKTEFDMLIATILEQKGVCRHRSYAFMVLAQLIGIPAKLIRNEKHAFCEVNGHLIELGGGDYLDLTPAERLKNPFGVLPEEKKVALKLEVKEVKELKKEFKDVKEIKSESNPYHQHFDDLIKQNQFSTINELLKNQSTLSPLIELSPSQQPLDVRKAIAQALTAKESYIYIHSPQDFLNYLTPYKLEDNAIKKTAGPLAKLLSEGGFLIVNWSNFNPQELATYKSILDSKPTLQGQELKNVKVIGLKTPDTTACSAFISRCQRYTLGANCLTVSKEEKTETKETKETKGSDSKPIDADLLHHSSWRERLLGKIKFGQTITLEDGPLLQAIKQNCPLNLINPPNDEGFKLFLRQLQDERRFLYMDKWIEIPNGVTITTQQKPQQYSANKINIRTDHKHADRELIYLSAYNIHECFEKTVTDEKTKQLTDVAGFLKEFQESKSAFYITSFISQPNWNLLQHHIHKHFPNKSFEFILGPGGEIEGIDKKADPVIETKQAPSSIIVSSDPDFECMQMKNRLNDNVLIIDVTPQMGIQDLLMKVQRNFDSKDIFSIQQRDMATALLNEKKVILNGELSPALYQQLQSLLSVDQPHFYLDGQRIKLSPNQFTLILPLTAKKSLPIQNCLERQYPSVKNYTNTFPKDDQLWLNQIAQFYDYAKKVSHSGGGLPTEVRLSHHLLKRMIEKLKVGKLHPQNPIKGLFHYNYPKDNKDFAYLNVAAKLCFRTKNTEVKLDSNKVLPYMKNPEHFKKHAWQALNCLNQDVLQKLFPNGLNPVLKEGADPVLKDDVINTIWLTLSTQFSKETKLSISKVPHTEKRTQQLSTLLEDKKSQFILLKGEAGVGKSYTVRQLRDKLNFSYFEGEDEIQKWLGDKSTDKAKVLLLDEVNLAKPGTWDFLKGLSRENKVYYNGKSYSLTDQHKIIMTGNPEYYSGRHHHSFFQDYAETIYFKMPDPEFIEKNILNKILPTHLQSYNKMLLTAYQLAVKSNPTFVYSNRDLESLAQRLCLMANDSKNDIRENILNACYIEFSGSFYPLDKRTKFISELSQALNISAPLHSESIHLPSTNNSDKKLFIPKEKFYCVQAIRQDLALRQKALEAKEEMSYKQGILIEGGPGIGKSTLFEALLIEKGYSKDESTNSQKKYYVISAGDQSAHDILQKAFHEGAAVILDELNLDKSLEKLLNQLLTGNDLQGKKAEKPGFMVLASQNPSFEKGRHSLSQALRNRCHMIYMEPHSKEAMLEIASENKLATKQANQFVEAYLSAQNKNPTVNMRTFYTGLNTLPQESMTPRIRYG